MGHSLNPGPELGCPGPAGGTMGQMLGDLWCIAVKSAPEVLFGEVTTHGGFLPADVGSRRIGHRIRDRPGRANVVFSPQCPGRLRVGRL